MKRCTIALLVFVVGCQTPLDIRQAELIETWGEGNKTFAKVIEEYCNVMGGVADNYHQSQCALRDKNWEIWLGRHTQADGGLVFKDTDGSIKPMRVEQLRAAIVLRDQASETIVQSERTWQEVDAKIRKAIEDFDVMTQVSMSTNADIAEAKRSAQQFAESALSALAGIASGFGLGVAVAP